MLSALVFAVLVFVTRLLFRAGLRSGKTFIGQYTEIYIYRYIAHHRIFDSEEVPEPLRIFFYVCLSSLAWFLVGLLMLVFFYGVRALAAGDWFLFFGHWFAFNSIFEGYMWARDSRNDKTAKALYEEKTKKLQESKTNSG